MWGPSDLAPTLGGRDKTQPKGDLRLDKPRCGTLGSEGDLEWIWSRRCGVLARRTSVLVWCGRRLRADRRLNQATWTQGRCSRDCGWLFITGPTRIDRSQTPAAPGARPDQLRARMELEHRLKHGSTSAAAQTSLKTAQPVGVVSTDKLITGQFSSL